MAPSLGILGLRVADGPSNVLIRHCSTAPTGLDATFTPEDGRLNGIIIGRDARALGIDVALQPLLSSFSIPHEGELATFGVKVPYRSET